MKSDPDKMREDVIEASRERDAAITRVWNNNEDWVCHAVSVIHSLCTATSWITADDVWRVVNYLPRSNNALGAAMRKAARLKYIERTSETRKSHRIARHRGDVRVWRSLIYKA